MKIGIKVLVLFLFVCTICACSDQPTSSSSTEPVVEATNKPPVEEASEPTQTFPSQMEDEVSFSRDIYPIFQQVAASCHGTSGGLSLETYEGTMKVVVPGDPEGSLLYQRLKGQGGPVMPPNGPLPDAQIQLIYQWIKQGAKNN